MQIDAADAELLKEGEEVTLMSWGNCIVRKVTRGAAGVEAIEAELHLEGDVKKTKLKLTWLADVPELIDLEVRFYGHLLTKKKIEEDDDVADIANKDSLSIIRASGDPNMRNLNKGDVIQLERKGFYIVEQAMGLPGQHLVLINIPDGRQK